MKALVTGFVDRPPNGQDSEAIQYRFDSRSLSAVPTVQRKPTTSLASYDIELLKVWYGVLRDSSGRFYTQPSACRADISEGPEPPPQLVVFLHDFGQFDESVVQDLFYICRWATNLLLYASLKEVSVLTCRNSP
jgi:origin recognition complex subunit 3